MYLVTPGGKETLDPGFWREVRHKSGQPVELCYHCQMCQAGCPLAPLVPVGPNRVLRLVQFGARRSALTAEMIWLCTTCEACSVTCPNGIKLPRVMEALRELAMAAGLAGDRAEAVFRRVFHEIIAARGRISELFLMLHYKLAVRDFFRDVGLGWRLFRHGKLPLKRHGVEDPREIRRILRERAEVLE